MGILLFNVILSTLIISPHQCRQPCMIHYMATVNYPGVRGEMCLHMSDGNEDVRKSCWDVDGSKRFWSNEFRDVMRGMYLMYITINEKIVSDKRTLEVVE